MLLVDNEESCSGAAPGLSAEVVSLLSLTATVMAQCLCRSPAGNCAARSS
jgi:hypothetical protein